MKLFIYAAVCALLLTGCQEKKEDQQQEAKSKAATDVSKREIEVTKAQVEPVEEEYASLYQYDIDGNRKLNLAYDGQETETTEQIKGMATTKNSYDNVSDHILGKTMSKNFIVKCSACHNRYANGVVGPSLLDKTAEEISDMISAYRQGTEKNVLMKYLVSQMDQEEIDALAEEIADLNKEVRESK